MALDNNDIGRANEAASDVVHSEFFSGREKSDFRLKANKICAEHNCKLDCLR